MVQFEETNWYFISSRLQHRFEGPELWMTFFQYGYRELQFDDLIHLVNEAIIRYRFSNSSDSEPIKKDKLDLLRMVVYAFEKFSADRNLTQIFPGNGVPESNLEFTKQAVIKKLTDLTRKSLENDDDDETETVSDDYINVLESDAEMIVNLYIDGIGALQDMEGHKRKHAYFMTEMLKVMKDMRPDANDIDATAKGFTQFEWIQVWQKLYIKLTSKQLSRKTTVSQNYVQCCICFVRMAYGSLSGLTSTFHLERTGFIAY